MKHKKRNRRQAVSFFRLSKGHCEPARRLAWRSASKARDLRAYLRFRNYGFPRRFAPRNDKRRFYSFTCFMDRLMRCFFSSTSSTTTFTMSPTATISEGCLMNLLLT
jgi:hypothetical protein